jgi:hypothetical protein
LILWNRGRRRHGNNERDEMGEILKDVEPLESLQLLGKIGPLKFVVPASAGRMVPRRPLHRKSPHRPCFVRLKPGLRATWNPAVGMASLNGLQVDASESRPHPPLAFIFASFRSFRCSPLPFPQ